MLNFGNQVLALTEDGRYLHAWDVGTGNLDTSIVFDDGFTATHVIHPATMLNKVLVASAEGSMQLWNIRTRYTSIPGYQGFTTYTYGIFPVPGHCFIDLIHKSLAVKQQIRHAQLRLWYNHT